MPLEFSSPKEGAARQIRRKANKNKTAVEDHFNP
jgi:hypothetical protein